VSPPLTSFGFDYFFITQMMYFQEETLHSHLVLLPVSTSAIALHKCMHTSSLFAWTNRRLCGGGSIQSRKHMALSLTFTLQCTMLSGWETGRASESGGCRLGSDACVAAAATHRCCAARRYTTMHLPIAHAIRNQTGCIIFTFNCCSNYKKNRTHTAHRQSEFVCRVSQRGRINAHFISFNIICAACTQFAILFHECFHIDQLIKGGECMMCFD
jgi:hypothetical protein